MSRYSKGRLISCGLASSVLAIGLIAPAPSAAADSPVNDDSPVWAMQAPIDDTNQMIDDLIEEHPAYLTWFSGTEAHPMTNELIVYSKGPIDENFLGVMLNSGVHITYRQARYNRKEQVEAAEREAKSAGVVSVAISDDGSGLTVRLTPQAWRQRQESRVSDSIVARYEVAE